MNLNLVSTIFEFVISFGVLLFLHEFGHFIVARLSKVEVEEFGFGFPPRLVKLFNWKGTDFTLNWIPFGAFVRPKGENDPQVAGGLAAAKPSVKLGVLLGGPAMNILTGLLLFSFLFTRTGAPDTRVVQILEVSQPSPAASSGLKANDIIRELNGQSITSNSSLSALVRQNLGREITLKIQRGQSTLEITTTPRANPPPNQGALGIMMGNPIVPITWIQSLPLAALTTIDQAAAMVLLPARLIQGQVSPDQARFVGPVGMYDIYSQVRNRDIQGEAQTPNVPAATLNRLWLLATISIALGFTNLLPIPALDGGRIIFVLPEILFRKRIPAQYENMVHMVGFAALLILMVYITTQDITHRIVIP